MLAVAAATYRGRRRRRYGPAHVALFALLATHTNSEGIARVSAQDLATQLGRESTHVRADLRALTRGGHVEPLELVDGALVASTARPRYRAGYLVPAMVAPPPSRPHVVR